jgi:hypothetical protein
MTRILPLLALSGALFVCLLASSAQAQTAIRTYVSVSGSDSNPCSLTAPCRHFSAAVPATVAGGEIDALDPGGYGAVTINQAITINGQGWAYVAPGVGGNGITVGGGGDVIIRGVLFNGVGVAGDTNGIYFGGGGTLTVLDCAMLNFSQAGLNFNPVIPATLFVSNTSFSTIGTAIWVNPYGVDVSGTIDHVQVNNATVNGGVYLNTSIPEGAMNFAINDSVISNSIFGIEAQGNAPNQIQVIVRNTTLANNPTVGVLASNATMWVTRTSISGSITGVYPTGGGTIISYGDNDVENNESGNAFLSTMPHQ